MGINPKNIINILCERFCNYNTDTQVNTDEKTLAKNLIEIVENAVYNEVEFINDLQIDQVEDENECVESDSDEESVDEQDGKLTIPFNAGQIYLKFFKFPFNNCDILLLVFANFRIIQIQNILHHLNIQKHHLLQRNRKTKLVVKC